MIRSNTLQVAQASPRAPVPASLPRSAPTAADRGRSGGFFRYHGIWAPGIRLFRTLGFTAKAVIISLAFLLPLLGLQIWLLKTQVDQAMSDRMNATRQHVEIALGVLSEFQAREADGSLTRAEAQAQAARTVKRLRYDGNEYFWINDMAPRMVMHPIKPELDGQELGGMKDPNGFALFQGFVAKVRSEGKGFVNYLWPKPGSATPVDKISYVQGFAPWGWVIGSGVYVGDLQHEARQLLTLAGGVSLAVLLLAGYLFLSFYRVMEGGLRETRRHLRAMTDGDLTTVPSPWGKDEIAQLMCDLRAMQASLRQMVQRVRASSDDIVQSSSEIAAGAMDLSHRTENAAANLQESAASMEEIAATVRNTADHIEEASRHARSNATLAAEGGEIMQDVVCTMERIRGSSQRIAEIIGTIDGIAFQTNILALNAAVEAARAGELGKGFAVVATEVRLLAKRSTEASREIKQLISASVEEVGAGSAIVQRAGSAIGSIVSASDRVDHLLGEVSTGAQEQSAGVAQIGQSVQDLDRMTQQNAALVEETAAAASTLREQARTLADEVARFRLPV